MIFLDKVLFLQKLLKDLMTLHDYFETRRAVQLMQVARAIFTALKQYCDNKIPNTPEPEMSHELHAFRKDMTKDVNIMHKIFLDFLHFRNWPKAFKALIMKFSILMHYHQYKNKIQKYYDELDKAIRAPQAPYERIDYDAIDKDKRENPWKYRRPKYDVSLFPKKRLYSPFEINKFMIDYMPRGKGDSMIMVTTQDMVLGNGSNEPITDEYEYDWKPKDFVIRARQGHPLILLL